MTNDPVRLAHTVQEVRRVTQVVAHRSDLLPTLVTGGHAC